LVDRKIFVGNFELLLNFFVEIGVAFDHPLNLKTLGGILLNKRGQELHASSIALSKFVFLGLLFKLFEFHKFQSVVRITAVLRGTLRTFAEEEVPAEQSLHNHG